jgi:CheY-like chemotaxis protein
MNKYLMQRAADVLLIVGDFDEQRQIRRSLQQAKIMNRLHHVGDTAEASSYLRQEGPYLYAPRPGLVLLDASLPRSRVIDLITLLKTDALFAGIPVIALVGPESEQQLLENCIYEVDGCVQKPFHLPDLIQVLMFVETLSFLLLQSAPAK